MTTSDAPGRRLSTLIAPPFYDVHRDVREGSHIHYWLRGGRGSGKSSYVSIEIALGVMRHPGASALVLRKYHNTLRDSVWAQLLWAAGQLGAGARWDASPSLMRLTYRPGGGQILLRGLDSPEKLKSIRVEKGRFRYIWFEELTEFAGMAEIRSALQSVLRGGERHACFYTYNPPRSRRCWVNEECAAEVPGRLVHRSDYRAMPPGWLGETFLAEAEALRAARPEIYAHEYLGEATGCGTEVFQNLTLRPIADAEIASFPTLCRGLDFGYAGDPLHYAVCHYDAARRRLFIFHELHLLRVSNARLAEKILAEQRLHGRGAVCCDSEDPKSIDDLYLLGVPAYAAKKGPGSVGWGMRFLAEEVEEIVIDPSRCPNTRREFYAYALDTDGYGNAIPRYPDRDNHSIDAVRYALEHVVRRRYARGKA